MKTVTVLLLLSLVGCSADSSPLDDLSAMVRPKEEERCWYRRFSAQCAADGLPSVYGLDMHCPTMYGPPGEDIGDAGRCIRHPSNFWCCEAR